MTCIALFWQSCRCGWQSPDLVYGLIQFLMVGRPTELTMDGYPHRLNMFVCGLPMTTAYSYDLVWTGLHFLFVICCCGWTIHLCKWPG